MFYKKGGGDIWSILTLNNVFFLGKMEKTCVAEGWFTYSHNIISIYHPKWWFFDEDQKCSWGPKMKNKPNFFFDNRGFPNWGGGPPLGNFSHIIPFFLWWRPLFILAVTYHVIFSLPFNYFHFQPTFSKCDLTVLSLKPMKNVDHLFPLRCGRSRILHLPCVSQTKSGLHSRRLAQSDGCQRKGSISIFPRGLFSCHKGRFCWISATSVEEEEQGLFHKVLTCQTIGVIDECNKSDGSCQRKGIICLSSNTVISILFLFPNFSIV